MERPMTTRSCTKISSKCFSSPGLIGTTWSSCSSSQNLWTWGWPCISSSWSSLTEISRLKSRSTSHRRRSIPGTTQNSTRRSRGLYSTCLRSYSSQSLESIRSLFQESSRVALTRSLRLSLAPTRSLRASFTPWSHLLPSSKSLSFTWSTNR